MKQNFTTMTPGEYLLKVVPLTEAEHTVEAEMPSRKTRSLLEMESGEPCLVLHRKTWSNETVATESRFIYPGSRHRIGGRFKSSSPFQKFAP